MYAWHKKESVKKRFAAASICVLAAFYMGAVIGGAMFSKTVVVRRDTVTEKCPLNFYSSPVNLENATGMVSMSIPAVDENGEGVPTYITVQTAPGTGRVLASIDNLLFWVDTQNSIRRATQVAEKFAGVNASSYDIVYTIYANASVIGGPSAGAAITIATIAALRNQSLRDDIAITGTINHDGTIGPVADILQKAMAAKKLGAKLMLVPISQAEETDYKKREYCEKIGWMDFCSTETYPVKIDVSGETGIDIKEIMSIEEAMRYMITDSGNPRIEL